MGTNFYLYRPDTETFYDLGKSYELADVFGPSNRGEMHQIRLADATEFAELVEIATFEREDGGPRALGPDTPDDRDYVRWYARDIVRWADGQPFEFVDEHNDTYGNIRYGEGLDEGRGDACVTGSRFRPAAPAAPSAISPVVSE